MGRIFLPNADGAIRLPYGGLKAGYGGGGSGAVSTRYNSQGGEIPIGGSSLTFTWTIVANPGAFSWFWTLTNLTTAAITPNLVFTYHIGALTNFGISAVPVAPGAHNSQILNIVSGNLAQGELYTISYNGNAIISGTWDALGVGKQGLLVATIQ